MRSGSWPRWSLALTVREPPRGGLDPDRRRDDQKSGFFATLRMFFSRPSLVLVAFGGGATQFVTYGLGNFTTLFLMREKGMTLDEVAIYYALVVAHRDERRDRRVGLGDRSLHAAVEAGLRALAGGLAGAGDTVLHRVRLGAGLAAGAAVS